MPDNTASVVIAGMWGRPLNYHEADVGQADFCCCQALQSAAAAPQRRACVDFEPPLAAGTKYGASAGQSPGDLAFAGGGIPVTIENFTDGAGNLQFNEAYIEGQPQQSLNGQSLRSNNINLKFDFASLPFAVGEVSLKFADLGGIENIVIDGTSSFVGNIGALPLVIGNASPSVLLMPITGGSGGTARIVGQMGSFAIGGQELWIDEVCALQ